jgi:hypothetical protein
MKKIYNSLSFFLLFIFLATHSPVSSQCVLPGGAIEITQASFGSLGTVASGQVYYVPPGTIVNIDHSSGNLTVAAGGTILVMGDAILNLSMGSKNMTVNGGTIKLCDGARLNISPCHDFTFQNSSLIQLGLGAHLNMCNFGHDITFNGGTIQMNDFSSIEFDDFHNLKSNANNLVTYTGSGAYGIGTGNPIFHISGTDFATYTNTSSVNVPLTASSHIDFINDALGSDNPGAANYCGPKTSPTYPTCRLQWSGMPVDCGSAFLYQSLLPVHFTFFNYKKETFSIQLLWAVTNLEDLDHFEIERSAADGTYHVIATVLPEQFNTNSNNFSYNETTPFFTDARYRVKMIKKDGTIIYSEIILVRAEKKNNNNITCFPNPFSDKLQVNSSLSESSAVEMGFFNQSGKKVHSTDFHAPVGNVVTELKNFASLSPGIYLLKIVTKENTFYQHVIKK